MLCSSCGKEIPEASTFCLHCGKAVGAAPSLASKPTRKTGLRVLVVLLVVATTVLVFHTLQRNTSSTRDAGAEELIRKFATPVVQQVKEKIVSGQVVVRAGHYTQWKMSIDPTKMINPRLVGSFRASGGSGNDIQVVLAEESEFVNWINGHEARVLYSTGKTTTGKIDVLITEAGTYYLAFSNKFSAVSDKDVFAGVELRYSVRR